VVSFTMLTTFAMFRARLVVALATFTMFRAGLVVF
jgi:hypothetical protein